MKTQAFLQSNSKLLISVLFTAVVITLLLLIGRGHYDAPISYGYDALEAGFGSSFTGAASRPRSSSLIAATETGTARSIAALTAANAKEAKIPPLTEVGHGFLREAEPILLRFEGLERRFKNHLLNRQSGTLTVGGSHGPSASFLPSLLAVFQESHPQVQFRLRTSSSSTIERLVLKAEVEIALVTNPPTSMRIAMEPYRKEKILAFASVGHPLAKKLNRTPKMTLKEFARAPLIIRQTKRGKGSVEKILQKIEERGLKPNIVMYCDSPEAAKAAVKRKMGLGILCQDIVAPEIKRGDFKAIRVSGLKMETDIFIIYCNGRPLSANAQAFLALLRKQRHNKRK